MIKKHIIPFLLSFVLLLGMCVPASASDNGPLPYASNYLERYSVALGAHGNGKMTISTSIDGVGRQDKIGVLSIDIEKKVNGVWQYYDTIDSIEHPEFFAYDSYDYVGAIDFYGTPGVAYRVTILAYAKKGSGSDTGTVTSPAVVCK